MGRWILVLAIAIFSPVLTTKADNLETGRLEGRQAKVNCLAISDDGKIAASGSSMDGLICIWDVPNHKFLRSLKGQGSNVNCLSMTNDGKRLANCGADGGLCVWDVTTGDLLCKSQLDTQTYAVAISADGKVAAFGTGMGTVRLVDVEKDRTICDFQFPKHHISYLALTPDGSQVAISPLKHNVINRADGVYDYTPGPGFIGIYAVVGGKEVKTIKDVKYCEFLRFVNGGKQLQWINDQEGYGIVDTTTWETRKVGIRLGQLLHPTLPASGAFAVVANGSEVLQFRPGDDMPRKLPSVARGNEAVALSADGSTLLVGGRGNVVSGEQGGGKSCDGCVLVLNLGTAAPTKRFAATKITVNGNGSCYTITQPGGMATEFWDVAKGEKLSVSLDHRTAALVADDLKRYFMVSQGDLAIESLERGRRPKRYPVGRAPMTFALSPDNHLLLVGPDASAMGPVGATAPDPDNFPAQQVRVFDAAVELEVSVPTTKPATRPAMAPRDPNQPRPVARPRQVVKSDLATLEIGKAPVFSIAFSPDSKKALISCSAREELKLENSLQVWDLTSFKLLQKITVDRRYLAKLSSRDIIYAPAGREIRRWNANTGESMPALPLTDGVRSISLSPDGTRILVSEAGANIKCLDAESGKVLSTTQPPETKDADVQYLLDGRAVAVLYRFDQSASVIPLELPR